jgi:hypothetical protein
LIRKFRNFHLKRGYSIKKLFAVILIASLIMFTGMSCAKKSVTGPDTSTLNPNAGTLSAHSEANAPVSDANKATVSQSVQTLALNSAMNALELQGMAKRLATAGTTGGTINDSITGNYSGTAKVTGTWSGNQSTGVGSVNVTCTFTNYSDGGTIYIAGQMEIVCNVTVNMTTGAEAVTATINGNIRFNGVYMGTNDFSFGFKLNVSASGQESGTYTYSSTFVSDGNTVTYSMNGSL